MTHMDTTDDLVPIRSTSTGLLTIEVLKRRDGHIWTHHLGAEAPLPFSRLRMIQNSHVGTNVISLGEGNDHSRSYATNTEATVFELLQVEDTGIMGQIGRLWGQALNTLHATPTADLNPPLGVPRTIKRAGSWLAGGWPAATAMLGNHGLERINAWIIQMVQSPQAVLVHGHPGMAHWTVSLDGQRGALLTGEDTGLADPGYDFGWILGEITELHAFRPELRASLESLRNGLLEHYGQLPSASMLATARAFRLTQHAYDWHHHAGATLDQANLLLQLAAAHLQAHSPNLRKLP